MNARAVGRRHGEGAAPGLRLLRRALLTWGVVLAAAFATIILRDSVLAPLLGGAIAQILSMAALIAVLLLAAVWLVKVTHPRRPLGQWLLVGLLWAALTLAFEFLFFHYVVGMSWDALLAALDPRQGGIFGLIVLAMLLAPPLVALRHRR